MRTRANYKSHPIHPAFVPYPIAFLHGAFVCDVAGRLTGKRRWWQTGALLGTAGVALGVVAAVPGLIDYIYSVPPASSGKKRATKHLLANAGALALFGVSRWLHGRERGAPGLARLGLEAAGVGLLTSGAWMGSTLIHRNFMGPEHRYPEAGKWREEEVPAVPGRPVAVARADELGVDQMKLLRVGERRIVLARTEDGYVAFDDHCTHRGGSLADGVMICSTVQCLWHGSQFDVRTGEVKSGPAEEPIGTYAVEVAAGEVRLVLEPPRTRFPAQEGEEDVADYVAERTGAGGGGRGGRSGADAGGPGLRGGAAPGV